MAHELTIRENGSVEMAYAGETPWHGLGNVLESGAAIEDWLTAAGMDWNILRARVRYAVSKDGANDPGSYKAFDGKCVLLRSDSKDGLGIVSDDYKPVQPREVLEFFRDLVGAAGMELETAGTLFGGRRFWAMARVTGEHPVKDAADKVKANLLLATACDGSMATEGLWLATRVVCNNTLQFGRGEKNAIRVKVRHSTKFNAAEVKADLGIEQAQNAFERALVDMRELASKPVSPNGVIAMTATLLHPEFADYDADKKDKVLRSKPVMEIGRLAINNTAIGSGMDGTDGTAWQFVNAVTQYVDHSARAQTIDNRLNSAWFGKGSELKERAFAMAQSYLPSMDELIASTNEAMAETIAAQSTGSALLDSVLESTIL